jgi:hypothetical protein
MKGLLLGYHGQMGWIHEGHDEGHIWIPSIVLGIGKHGDFRGSECVLFFFKKKEFEKMRKPK